MKKTQTNEKKGPLCLPQFPAEEEEVKPAEGEKSAADKVRCFMNEIKSNKYSSI